MDIINIFNEYGWTGVILIIFSIFILYFLKRLMNKFGNTLTINVTTGIEQLTENLTKNINNQNKELVYIISEQNNKLINYFVNDKKENKEEHSEKLSKRMFLSTDINSKLRDILNINHCQRVSIIEFHNSNSNIDGNPFAKYSMTYEFPDSSTKSIICKTKDIQFSIVSQIYQDILNSEYGYVTYDSLDYLKENNPALFQIMNEEHIKSGIFLGIYDNDNRLTGFVGVEYNYSPIPKFINYNDLLTDTANIATMLTVHHKYNIDL